MALDFTRATNKVAFLTYVVLLYVSNTDLLTVCPTGYCKASIHSGLRLFWSTPALSAVTLTGNTFAGVSVLFQVVALATVALIRAVDVGALLATGILVTFIHI